MNSDQKKIREAFLVEAAEHTAALELALLELERNFHDQEAIASIFRSMHTIKGSGAMAGFDDVSAFAHQIEAVYDLIRNKQAEADRSLIDLTFAASDLINDMIRATEDDRSEMQERAAGILGALLEQYPEIGRAGKRTALSRKPAEKRGQGKAAITYRIQFRPSPNVFMSGTNPVLLLNELRSLGQCVVIAQKSEVPQLEDIDPELCYTYWDVILTTGSDLNAIRDIFIFVEDESDLKIDVIDEGDAGFEEKDYKRIGEILVDRSDITEEDLNRVLDRMKRERKPFGEVLSEEGLVKPQALNAALAEQEHVRHLRETRIRQEMISNLRVPAEKLDALVNLVGELVTVQARLSQSAVRQDDPELLTIAEEVERLTEELRENTMNIRMLPIGTLFTRFRRLVRDLGNNLGKDADLSTDGGETELDKSVIEKLNDPLVHIIRNCMDHGIEPADVRMTAGKPKKGTIHLAAYHSGASVMIEITDDGAGMDTKAIFRKAVERGLVSQDTQLSEREIYDLVFAPGFSTAEKVTSVSGRGVGLDVLKSAIDSLRGSITIRSEQGAGTTITLSLPLTLAIIEGLLVKVGEEIFVLPLSSVEECIELIRGGESELNGRQIVNVRGQVIPYIRMRDHFLIDGARPEIEQIVIIHADSHRIGLVVDTVIGEHQTVIKNLGRFYAKVQGFSGATILGDGSVALILDVPKLIGIAEKEEMLSTGGKHN